MHLTKKSREVSRLFYLARNSEILVYFKNKPHKKQLNPSTLPRVNPAQQMYKYLHTKQCRWQFLLTAFGFGKEAGNWRCGHCDNCQV